MNAAPLIVCCAIALMAPHGDAAAQTHTRQATVYRCGPDGRELRDSPCPGDTRAAATRVDYEQPSDADRQAARQHLHDDQRRARELERERRKREAEGGRQVAIHIDGLSGSRPGQDHGNKSGNKSGNKPDDKPLSTKKPKLAKSQAPSPNSPPNSSRASAPNGSQPD